MRIVFSCPKCGAGLKVPEDSAGKRMKCPTCSASFIIPTPAPEESPSEKVPLLPAMVLPADKSDHVETGKELPRPRGRGTSDKHNDPSTKFAYSLYRRYEDGYIAAKRIANAGKFTMFMSKLAGLAGVVICLYQASETSEKSGGLGRGLWIAVLVMGVFTAVQSYVGSCGPDGGRALQMVKK